MADVKSLHLFRSQLAYYSTSTPSVSNFSMNSTTGGAGWVFNPETTDAITTVGFRVGARTGNNSITYTVGVETVSLSTGFPTGTYRTNGGTDCKQTFTPATDGSMDGTWQEVTLAASYIPTNPGELSAITIRADGTVSGTQFISVSTNADGDIGWGNTNFPCAARLTTGTWSTTYSGSAPVPIFGYGTASRYYGYPYLSNYAGATAATVGRRIAFVVNVPTSLCSTYKVRGFMWVGAVATASGKAPIAGLWSAGGVLQNATLDSDVGRAPTTTLRQSTFIFDESSLSTLNAGTDYYFGLEVADAAGSAITLNGVQYHSSTQAASDSGGAIVGVATFDGSNWSSVDYSVRPYVELILEDVTQAAGATGGIVIGG